MTAATSAGISVARMPANFNALVALAKHIVEPLATAQHGFFAHQ